MSIQLKHPLKSYQPRLSRFLISLLRVKNLRPYDFHLWEVMDSVSFQDTETTLETKLLYHKAGRTTQRQVSIIANASRPQRVRTKRKNKKKLGE